MRPLLALPLFCHWFPTRHVLNHDLQLFCWKPLTPRSPTITGMQRQGATEREACDNFWVADYRGLVTAERADLSETVAPFARQPGGGDTEGEALADVVRRVRFFCHCHDTA